MRRTALKWLHWSAFFLLLYFFFVEPDEPERSAAIGERTAALANHAGFGLLLAVLVAIWWLMYWSKGAVGRPGPKLPGWAKTAHRWMHLALYWALPVMVLSGGLTGLLAPFPVIAFDVVPLNFGLGGEALHEFAEEVHELIFDALTILVIAHIAFHLWRHYLLRDNALRIIAPRLLHRWL